METISETKQPLLKRTVSVHRVAYDGATPKRTFFVDQLTKKTKATVIVTHVYTINGQQTALVHANIYQDAGVAAAVERQSLLTKQQEKAAEKPAELATETPKEAA